MRIILIALTFFIISCKQHQPMAGGKHQPDPNDSGVPKAIAFAKTNFQSSCSGVQGYTWDKVLSIESQIVNGSNYYITASIVNGSSTKKIQVVVWIAAAPPSISITKCSVF